MAAPKRSKLYLFTFISIFLTLVAVGGLLSPLFLDTIRTTYLEMNEDLNRRQAKIISDIISNLLKEGENQESIVSAIQASLAHTELQRGYLCLVDEKTGKFVAHPVRKYVGVKSGYFYSLFKKKENKKYIGQDGESEDMHAILPIGGRMEMINSYKVPKSELRVFSHDNIARLNQELERLQWAFILIFIFLGFVVAFPASYAALKVSRRYERAIEREQERSEALLLNILPQSIAERLKSQERNIANRFENVSVIFIDIVDFTPLASTISAEELVNLLSDVFSRFDDISKKYGLEKIKTIGDAYMLAGGIPEPSPYHLRNCIRACLEIIELVKAHYSAKYHINVRIGLHTGPLVAGVIGSYKFSYDLWGETVNIASRLESTSEPGRIHCSQAVYDQMKEDYAFEARDMTTLKGIGKRQTYFLVQAQ